MGIPLGELLDRITYEDLLVYKTYDSIKPINPEDYYHAIQEANRAACAGVKKVKTEDYFINWFEDRDSMQRQADKQRMEAAILKLEIAKKQASMMNKVDLLDDSKGNKKK